MSNSIDAAKAHILSLYNEKRNAASYDLAHSINLIVKDVLQGRLPFEFIQNADDASLPNQGTLSFELEGNTLIISHQGKQFSSDDVIKICAVAQQKYRDKIDNHQMIGQKGIGIKVAFSEADQMIVYSHPYCFRFQENYSEWCTATREEPYPWQITPIWTEFSELPKQLDPQKVHFVLRLRRPADIHRYLEDLTKDSRTLLFLNNVRRLSILGKELFMKVHLSGERELYQNGMIVSRWVFKHDPVLIPSSIRAVLHRMDHQSCPDRMKQSDYNLKLSFAFQVGDRGVVKTEDTVLSCYLPTSVRCKLPFLVNGDFLLEASRKFLQVNEWNAFVLEQIAHRHFYWLSQVARDPSLRIGILNILGPSQLEGIDPQLVKGYASAYQECRKLVKFISSQQNPDHFRSLVDCYLDRTGFFRRFKDHPLKEEMLPRMVDDYLDHVEVLSTVHQAPIWTYLDIISRSSTYLQDRPQLVVPYLEFFKDHWEKLGSLVQSQFRQQCMLPNGFGSLSPVSSFFLTSKESDSYPVCLPIPLFPADFPTPLKEWLHRKVGLSYLSQKEIVRGPLAAFVRAKKVDRSNTISIMRFLYSALFQEKHAPRNTSLQERLLEFDLPTLFPQILVLTTKGTLRLAQEGYLANQYDPVFRLESLIQDQKQLFISIEYLTQGDEIEVWKTLFLRLGARDRVALDYPPRLDIAHLKALNVSFLDDYLAYLYQHPDSPLKKVKNNDSHLLPNFVYIPFMNLLHIEAYAHHFWTEILNNWDTVYTLGSSPKYKISTQAERDLPISYIQYFVQRMPICSSSRSPLPGNELYVPQLREIVGEWFPTVNMPYALTAEQANFFGFKTQVHPLHCLEIFEHMRCLENIDISKYALLLEHLVEGFAKLNPDDRLKFQQKQKFVLAENNSWQLCTPHLKCSLIPGAVQRFDRLDRVKIVMSLDKMERLSTILGFGTIRPTEAPTVVLGAKEDKEFTLKLLQKLPLIALCEAGHLNIKALVVLRRLIDQARLLKIFEAKNIPLSSDYNDMSDTLRVGSTIYYRTFCSEKKRKLAEKICEYFQLSPNMWQLLPEILGLHEFTTMEAKGTQDFLRERGIQLKLLNELKAIYSHKELILDLPEEEAPVNAIEESEALLPIPPTGRAPPAAAKPLSEAPVQFLPGMSHSEPEEVIGDPTIELKAERSFQVVPPVQERQGAVQAIEEVKESVAASVPFKPTVTPAEIKFENIALRRIQPALQQEAKSRARHPGSIAPSTQRSEKAARKSEETTPIGRWGEEFIYCYLIDRFKNHNASTNKTKLRFVRTEEMEGGIRIFCLDEEEEDITIQLRWLNKDEDEDSYEQRDLDLAWIRSDRVVKQRWIEVKSSVENKIHFYLSGKEWGFMNDHLQDYRIYHVANAGTETPLVTKIKTLFSSGLRALNKTEFVGSSK